MKGDKVMKIEIVEVNPPLARLWLDLYLYDKQRPLRKNQVKFYADEMTKGKFDNGNAIKFVEFNDKKYLIDGQHRLSAIVQSGKTLSFPIFTEIVYTEDDLAEKYSTTDIGYARKWGDVVRVKSDFDIYLTKSQFNVLKSSLGLIYRGFMEDGMNMSYSMLHEKTIEWQPYAADYFNCFEHNEKGLGSIKDLGLQRYMTAAIGIVTFRFATKVIDKKDVVNFWKQVFLGDGLRIGDPRKTLRDLLYQSIVIDTSKRNKTFTSKQQMVYTIRAWNAYTNNEQLKMLKLPNSMKIPINYTPFDFSLKIEDYRKAFENSNYGDKWK